MGAANNLASFPNSRINPTPATSSAVQTETVAPANTFVGPLPVLVPANPNRTYLTIYNNDPTNGLKFVNVANGGPAPTAAFVLANGFTLIPGAAYEVDTPEAVYAVSVTAAPCTPIDLDEGSG
jgi:hypothetical protein